MLGKCNFVKEMLTNTRLSIAFKPIFKNVSTIKDSAVHNYLVS